MGTIIVYKSTTPTDAGRQTGMREAGARLQSELGQGFANEEEAEARVISALEFFITQPSTYLVCFEFTDTAGDHIYKFESKSSSGSIVADTDQKGRYKLTNLSNSADKRRLRLRSVLDDNPSQIFRMNIVVPSRANDSNSWDYLESKVYGDLTAIGASHAEEYLTSTFMFSRCR